MTQFNFVAKGSFYSQFVFDFWIGKLNLFANNRNSNRLYLVLLTYLLLIHIHTCAHSLVYTFTRNTNIIEITREEHCVVVFKPICHATRRDREPMSGQLIDPDVASSCAC